MDCKDCRFANSEGAREHDHPRPAIDLLHDIAAVTPGPAPEQTDAMLIDACLSGDERAWALLIERYKKLIYSFPRRYGADPSDAADVFQLVCAELFVSLPRLRKHESLRSWITAVASHQAYHWKRHHVKLAVREGADPETSAEAVAVPCGSDLEQAEREQMVREAVAQLPPRCRELVRLLFYQDPPVPYETIAKRLGLATGSIGLTRARCLRRVQDAIAKSGRSNGSRGTQGTAPEGSDGLSRLAQRPRPPSSSGAHQPSP